MVFGIQTFFSNQKRKLGSFRQKRRKSVSGVFFMTDRLCDDVSTSEESETDNDDLSLSSPKPSSPISWRSTDHKSFYTNQPLFVSDPDCCSCDSSPIEDEAVQLSKAMRRSKDLPGTWYYSSNHVMVNLERKKRVVAPLTRLSDLDELARAHAKAMAERSTLFHSNPYHLHLSFPRRTRILGENVAFGSTIREIHCKQLNNVTQLNNMVNRRYTHFGMGTAQGVDGQLFLCQVFRG